MTTVQELRTELDTLPTLIAQTAQAGNTVAARRLKARALEIPEELDAAQLDATRAALAELDARRAALRPVFDEARAELAELQAQRADIDAAIGEIEQRLHVVSSKMTSLDGQRERLKILAAAQQAENSAKWAGIPLNLGTSELEAHMRTLYPLVRSVPERYIDPAEHAYRPEWRDNTPVNLNRG